MILQAGADPLWENDLGETPLAIAKNGVRSNPAFAAILAEFEKYGHTERMQP